ncbi:Mu-like prophage major head subunit gpT family protein [Comamonas thiooxydans]|uniref:Mu-like prophage major head subunit gpT family protein n=1 Tax=Comamonas thiooxydans TaxID=363952 RepID=UPI001CCE751B|nr:Mu-like prophage major head subunit gpT family protein [Comamonas thiooxydans]UBQ43952.1 Mu-like prophage major head subunit gpT family protein [Comamonas thiooxydans]
MEITPQNLRNLFVGYRANFQGGLNQAESMYQQLATVVPSTTGSEEYPWLGQLPGMREWIGDRVIHGLETHGYTIKNKPFELTVGVKRTSVEDDTYGIYAPMMTELGRASGAQPDELAFGVLKDGYKLKCYDDKPFFADNHLVKDAKGKDVAQSNMDLGGNGESWYVMDTTRAIKPLIFQDRKKPNFVALTAETDPNVFTKAEYQYGVDSRSNVGFGFWQMAHASNQELTPDNLWKAIKSIEARKGDFGRPLALRATVLVVPPSMQDVANKLLTADLLASGGATETNTLKGRLKSMVVPWL